MKSPSYAIFCLLVATLLGPAPTTRVAYWPRSADYWAIAQPVNITIDDSSSLIAYSGNNTWRASNVPCTTCLAPNGRMAYAGTWHDGTHVLPTIDNDDLNTTTSGGSQQTATTGGAAGGDNDKGDGDGNGGDEDAEKGDDDDKKGGGKGPQRRRGLEGGRRLRRQDTIVSNPFFTPNLDSDDPGFVDKAVSVEFNFTGSAIYVFAIMPMFAAPANTTPTFMNLTYTFDSQPAGAFLHTGSASAPNTSYSPSVLVFQKSGLPETPHSLTVSVGPDSVFLLDYIVYTEDNDYLVSTGNTTNGGSPSNTTVSAPVGAAHASPSPSVSQTTASAGASSSKSHNVATFAGAVGGSVGLLAVLALSLAFSLYRRRMRARRRDRAYREARRETSSIATFHTDASEDGPPMQGPVPFVPRYFPGTVVNVAPPPYAPPAEPSNEPTSALLGTPETPTPTMLWSSRRTGGVAGDSDSYAEHAPPTPPVPSLYGDSEDGFYAPPPSFQVAIATPVPAILAGLSGVASPVASSTSPSPPSPPASPVIPLLPPPPSSRPASLLTPDAEAAAGPSTPGVHTPVMRMTVMRPAASSTSLRSLHPQSAEGTALGPDADTHSITRSSSESLRGEATAAGRAPPRLSIGESQGGSGSQAQESRSEGESGAAHQ
ncbi:hypothetical protein PsYK624_117790 [Phanerochaete sordida]|uniref:Uncharacterized protein n=1 Tax=Phanerochaete sordida TaxID=48140 RepID=A0A9P3LI06_9APHY|nr:hypothetical protein PsYK624_117790 [Phanerochaete sordida]